jgi:hypothetical protein
MPEFVVTVNRKITKEFKVQAKNRWQAKLMVKDKVLNTSMDCRENYGEDINEDASSSGSRDYISTVEPVNK